MTFTNESSAQEELSKARRWLATAVLSASVLVITMDMTILNIALPDLAADLQPSATQQLWIVDVYSLILAGLLISWAAIGDRWGRKRMLMLGYTIFGAASLLIFFAGSPGAVIAIRAFLGVGGAMIMPTTLSLIRVIFANPKERATALSIWAAVSGLGSAIGPLLGGYLLEHFTWHSAFLVNVPLMAVGVIAGVLILPESRVSKAGKLDPLGVVLSLVGMTLLVWSIKKFGEESSLLLPSAWIGFSIAALALTLFVRRCLHSDEPLLDLALFRNRQFTAGIVAALGTTFSLLAAILVISQWLQLVQGDTPIQTGIHLIPAAVAGAVASVLAPAFSRVIGARAVLAGGLAVAGLGMVLIGLQGSTLSLTMVIASLVLVGFGTGSLAIASAMIMGGSPEDRAGNAGALEETSYELGGVLGVAVLGSVSALVYKAEFAADAAFAQLQQYDAGLAERAKESLGAATAIANDAGIPELARRAGAAFTRSFEVTGLVGGVLMLAVAATVFFLAPKGTKITGEH
jgi:Arabinose efflux permease